MKPKTTIVLVILLLLVGLSVWLTKVFQRRANDPADSSAGKVFPRATSDAKKLTVEHRDGTKFVFVHTNDRWNMIEPRLLPARAEAVESIVRMMTDLTYRRTFPAGDSTATPSETVTGLDRPRWIVAMTDPAERTWRLQVGLAAPSVGGDEETYVRAGEQGAVYVVEKDLAGLLRRDVKDYRDMAALPEVRRDEIVAVDVAGRRNYTLHKDSDGWEITQPFVARAKALVVRELLTKLTTDLKARRFLTEATVSPASFGLDRPQLVVTVTTRGEPSVPASTQPTETRKTYTLLLGDHRGEGICAMVKGKPEVFTLPESMLDDLQPSLDTLRAKTLLTFNPAEVHRVQLVRDGETMVLQRNGGWSMTQPFAGPTEAGAADALLRTLANLRAEEWIVRRVGGSMNLSSPRATVRVSLRNGGIQTLRIGNVGGDRKDVFCQSSVASEIAVVTVQDVDKVLQPARRYWSRTLLPISPDADVLGMTIDRPDGAYVLAKCEDAWTLAAPVTGRADTKAVTKILNELKGLRATKIINLGESLPRAYGEAGDGITVSLTTRGPGAEPMKTRRLGVVKIGKKVFAWREDQPVLAVGLCPANLYTILTGSLEKTK